MVVTSPNMDYVPVYPVETTLIHTYADGLWGPFEYSKFPQPLGRGMWHIACIPASPLPPEIPAVLWTLLSRSSHWREDPSLGFNGLGYIAADVQRNLLSAAQISIRRFEDSRSPSNVHAYGKMLVLILRQVVDRMRCLPAAPNVAIAVAAHIQRVSLELCGLRTYAEVVVPRLGSSEDYSDKLLPVVGAFVREGTEAQNLTRVGIPTWFLQPLTHELPVWRIVDSRPWSAALSQERMNPPIFQRTSSLVGVANLTGNWQQSMLLTVSKHVAGNHLASLLLAEVPEVPWEEPLNKRAKVHDRHGNAARVHMRTSAAHVTASAPQNTGRCRRRGQRNAITQPPAQQNPSLPHRLSASIELHPSKSFTVSAWYNVPPVWEQALRAASPVPRTASSAVYFYPPPFLVETVSSVAGLHSCAPHPERVRVDEKSHRYLHNLVRIRHFLRIRMFDPSLAHEPLTIAEWRAALWGDYSIRTHPPRTLVSPSDLRQAQRRQDERNGVSRLFSRIAQLRSYRPDESVQMGDLSVTLDNVSNNPILRLQLLWECHEINFRAEVMALDTLLVQKSTWMEIHRWEREASVSALWGPPSSAVTVIPEEVPCHADFRWNWCDQGGYPDPLSLTTLHTFAKVLTRWPDCPEELVRAGRAAFVDYSGFSQLQTLAVKFYVCTFVNQYARLPVPPVAYPTDLTNM